MTEQDDDPAEITITEEDLDRAMRVWSSVGYLRRYQHGLGYGIFMIPTG
jgi:hypothetical protein